MARLGSGHRIVLASNESEMANFWGKVGQSQMLASGKSWPVCRRAVRSMEAAIVVEAVVVDAAPVVEGADANGVVDEHAVRGDVGAWLGAPGGSPFAVAGSRGGPGGSGGRASGG